MKPAGFSCALDLLLAGPACAQILGCAAPPPWSEAVARHGRPETEIAACLKAKAWETRNLDVPVRSVVGGIVAQCEVRAVDLEGPQASASRFGALRRIDANDRRALDQALADVTWSRRCAGR